MASIWRNVPIQQMGPMAPYSFACVHHLATFSRNAIQILLWLYFVNLYLPTVLWYVFVATFYMQCTENIAYYFTRPIFFRKPFRFQIVDQFKAYTLFCDSIWKSERMHWSWSRLKTFSSIRMCRNLVLMEMKNLQFHRVFLFRFHPKSFRLSSSTTTLLTVKKPWLAVNNSRTPAV